MNLTNSEIKEFLDEPKEFLDERLAMPINNEIASFHARGINTQSDYLIDINRKRCIITRITFQNRVETSAILLRLDIDTKPHRSPDGETISGTHLHIYQENYETAWAYELEDPRIQEFLPDFNPKPILQAIQQDVNGTNKVPMFDEFSNMCKFREHPAIYSNMF